MDSKMAEAHRIIRQELMRHRAYRETYNELSKMSNKDLADIGVSRGMIHEISLEACMREQGNR